MQKCTRCGRYIEWVEGDRIPHDVKIFHGQFIPTPDRHSCSPNKCFWCLFEKKQYDELKDNIHSENCAMHNVTIPTTVFYGKHYMHTVEDAKALYHVIKRLQHKKQEPNTLNTGFW
jgi:hypothetical protein